MDTARFAKVYSFTLFTLTDLISLFIFLIIFQFKDVETFVENVNLGHSVASVDGSQNQHLLLYAHMKDILPVTDVNIYNLNVILI